MVLFEITKLFGTFLHIFLKTTVWRAGHGHFLVVFGDITLVIGDEDSGERQGHNQTDKAQQCAPYRQRQQQYGRVQTHGLAHDLGRDDHVDDDLHNALARMTQKFCPVSAALSKARKAVGMRAKVCR